MNSLTDYIAQHKVKRFFPVKQPIVQLSQYLCGSLNIPLNQGSWILYPSTTDSWDDGQVS